MSPEDTYVIDSLNALLTMQLPRMSDQDQATWQAKITKLQTDYTQARKDADNTSLGKERQAQAKAAADAIAKAAPVIAKSVISAVRAFQAGDAVGGTAEVMDICASVSGMLGAVPTVGPAFTALGALFSVVSIILRMFGPKAESDVSKLEKFMEEMKAQQALSDINAVHRAVQAYARSLVKLADKLQATLAHPITEPADYDRFYLRLKATLIALDGVDPHDSPQMFENWKILEYLRNPANQEVEQWPTVLGVYCKTYSDIITSNMVITALANTDDMQARLADTAQPPAAAADVSAASWATLHDRLLDIQAYAEARQTEYESCNEQALAGLAALIPVAQGWGLYAHIGTSHDLWVTSGPKKLRENRWTRTTDGHWFRRIALMPETATTPGATTPMPAYDFRPRTHLIAIKDDGPAQWLDHRFIEYKDQRVRDATTVLSGFSSMISDMCIGEDTGTELRIYTGTRDGDAQRWGRQGGVTSWKLPNTDDYRKGVMSRDNWWPRANGPLTSISRVDRPRSVPGDPDAQALPIGWDGYILYGSIKDSTRVYVNSGNVNHDIDRPYNWGPPLSVAADQNYVWYFQPSGFAVATHASVLKAIRAGDGTKPRWIQFQTLPAHVRGANSYSPCADGTLTISAQPEGQGLHLEGTTYRIDVVAGTITLGAWTHFGNVEAEQVVKLPAPVWGLLQSLIVKLV